MGCRPWKAPDGAVGIVCSRARRPAKCQIEGCNRPHVALCDFPLRGSKACKTCDRKLCESHRRKRGADVDYCPTHDGQLREELATELTKSDGVEVRPLAADRPGQYGERNARAADFYAVGDVRLFTVHAAKLRGFTLRLRHETARGPILGEWPVAELAGVGDAIGAACLEKGIVNGFRKMTPDDFYVAGEDPVLLSLRLEDVTIYEVWG